MYILVSLVVGLVVGALTTYLVMRARAVAAVAGERAAVANELSETKAGAAAKVAELNATLEAERKQADEKSQFLTDKFKIIANDIFTQQTQRFTEQNQSNLDLILGPLKEKITDFQTKVESVYVTESKDRTALHEQVSQLMQLNQMLSEDAKNLTRALTGSVKTQGNWGEMILERILETSGLRKGEEYYVRETFHREDGSRAIPDFIIRLPGERNLVVDSKVSLTAYEQYVKEQQDDEAKQGALGDHLASVRGHIAELTSKNYQSLYELKSLDFVIMFVPIEPAFLLAGEHGGDIYIDAYRKNVLVTCPTTFLFVVRIVAQLWRQEAQNKNTQDIVKRGGELYNRLCDFVGDLEAVGTRLEQAKDSYTSAFNRLTKNKGNVIWQAKTLTDLGVKPTKALPATLVEASSDEETDTGTTLPAKANGP